MREDNTGYVPNAENQVRLWFPYVSIQQVTRVCQNNHTARKPLRVSGTRMHKDLGQMMQPQLETQQVEPVELSGMAKIARTHQVHHGPIRLMLVGLVLLNQVFNDLILWRVRRDKNTTTVCQPDAQKKPHSPQRNNM